MTTNLVLSHDEAQDAKASQALKRVRCEVYSRIVGYLRPVRDWNEGKQQEFDDRKAFAVPRRQRSSERPIQEAES
jgi:ribonucleoside-triphosphate reductase